MPVVGIRPSGAELGFRLGFGMKGGWNVVGLSGDCAGGLFLGGVDKHSPE